MIERDRLKVVRSGAKTDAENYCGWGHCLEFRPGLLKDWLQVVVLGSSVWSRHPRSRTLREVFRSLGACL